MPILSPETDNCPFWIGEREKFLFVCVEVLRPSQPSGVTSSTVSLPNQSFTGQAYSSKRLQAGTCTHSFARNWQVPLMNQRKGMIVENISWSNLHERMLQTRRGSNPQPPDYQADMHPTESQTPARKEENGSRKYDQSPWKNVPGPGGDQICNLFTILACTYDWATSNSEILFSYFWNRCDVYSWETPQRSTANDYQYVYGELQKNKIKK